MIKFESERELETFIYENPQVLTFLEVEGPEHTKIFRQFKLGDYGIIDLLVITKQTDTDYPEYHASIIELKNVPINLDAIKQTCRYMTGMNDLRDEVSIILTVDAHLICLDDETISSCMYVSDRIDDLSYHTYKIDPIEGFSIESHDGCCLAEPNTGIAVSMLDNVETFFEPNPFEDDEDES